MKRSLLLLSCSLMCCAGLSTPAYAVATPPAAPPAQQGSTGPGCEESLAALSKSAFSHINLEHGAPNLFSVGKILCGG